MSRVAEIIQSLNRPIPPYVPKPRGPIYFIEDIIRHMKDAPDDVIEQLRAKNVIPPYVSPKIKRVKKKRIVVPVEPVFEKPLVPVKKKKKVLKAVVKKI